MPQPKTTPSNQGARWVAVAVCLLLLAGVFLLAVRGMMPEKHLPKVADYEPWPEEVIEAARTIPIQSGGRIKPLETHASYLMLSMHGDRTIKVEGAGEKEVKIGPMAWMLDVVFRPKLAMELPTFRVDNSDVFEAILPDGVELKDKEKRDRYSYSEIEPYRGKLLSLGGEYQQKAEDFRREGLGRRLPLLQKQILELASNYRAFEGLMSYLAFARMGVVLQGAGADGSDQYQRVSTVMATADVIRGVRDEAAARGEPMPERVESLIAQVTALANASKFYLAILPPRDKEASEWGNAGESLYEVIIGTHKNPEKAIKDIVALEGLAVAQAQGNKQFAKALGEWSKDMGTRAIGRNEYKGFKTELSYNKSNWFFNALFFAFVPASLFLVLGWLSPKSLFGQIMTILVWIGSGAGLVMIVVGTIQRIVIMGRPPVGNLYDTIPFIAAGIVLVAMIAEVLTRRRLAIAVAPIAGFIGLALARLYEFGDASDPNDPLLAVLRSNFWLTTHVLTITFGYAAAFVAAAFGMIYLALRISGLDNGDKSMRRFITRITYGCVCFTLFLSLVGTVLGGIWANYSWGRFWGWDPKENGALLIVIWMLIILHGRLGGFLREWGVNLAAVFGAVITTFSWWHVNLLGVGLHSYGFSESKKQAVFLFYGLMGAVLLIGIGFAAYDYFSKMARKKAKAQAPPPLPKPEPAEG